jgi:hypothetical protein
MYYSERIPHDSGLYHEYIYRDNEYPAVAQILSENDSYWWIIQSNQSISRGYKSVADAKSMLFAVLDNRP